MVAHRRRERSTYRSEVPFRGHPLGCMLAFCDTIQEWGRMFSSQYLAATVFPSFKRAVVRDGTVTVEIAVPADVPGAIRRICTEKAAVLETISSCDQPFAISIDFMAHGIAHSTR